MKSSCLVFFCSLFFYLCNGQTCTSPVYNNSEATIKGPCPSSQVITPVGSTVLFNCFINSSGGYIPFWNVTNFPLIFIFNPIPTDIELTVPKGPEGFTSLTIKNVGTRDLVVTEVQCGLCKTSFCFSTFQESVISLPVQVITFGKKMILYSLHSFFIYRSS